MLQKEEDVPVFTAKKLEKGPKNAQKPKTSKGGAGKKEEVEKKMEGKFQTFGANGSCSGEAGEKGKGKGSVVAPTEPSGGPKANATSLVLAEFDRQVIFCLFVLSFFFD